MNLLIVCLSKPNPGAKCKCSENRISSFLMADGSAALRIGSFVFSKIMEVISGCEQFQIAKFVVHQLRREGISQTYVPDTYIIALVSIEVTAPQVALVILVV